MFLYRDILSHAWKNTWRSKYLWFFGLFAALLGGWGDLEIIFRGFNNDQGLFYGVRALIGAIFSRDIFTNIGQLLASGESVAVFMVLLVLGLLLILGLFLIWLSIVSQSALVYNTTKIIVGKKHNFSRGLSVGIKKFWPVFGLNLLLKFIIYSAISAFGIIIVSNVTEGNFISNNIYPIFAFLVFIPMAMIVSFIVKYAICFIVIKEEKMIDSIKMSWSLFVKNWLVSLEMAFILFFITFLYALALMFLFLILSVPFLFISLVLIKLSFLVNLLLTATIALIFFVVIIVVSGSMLVTFQIYSWTALFLELISRGGVSKITRIFEKK